MVFFFESSEGYVIYMGRDKYENEDLIRYGLPEDLWFHVDDLSSAHVYLRMRKGQTIEELSPAAIMECAQLVKANSIEGCKKSSVYVIYTPWSNLLKTSNMEAGQVSYHDQSKVVRILVEKSNPVVNKLNKTKVERNPNLAEEQALRDQEMRADQKAAKRAQIQREKEETKSRREADDLRSFSSYMKPENMRSNADASNLEDDFM